MSDDQVLVDKLETVWRSIGELCSSLTEDEWKRPTDVPVWSVQDNLSHIVGTESMLLGRAAPDHTPADTSHVHNPIGEANEVQVDYRRSWSGAKVLEEFREVTAERLRQMRSWSTADFDKDSFTPTGPGTVRDFLQVRIFDAWVHEQDIRRALGRPGHMQGPVVEHSFGRIRMAMGFVVGKKAAAPQGSTVVLDIAGTGTIAIGVEGRASELPAPPSNPTVRLSMDLETLNALGCGRWDPAKTLAEGRVRIDGDAELGTKIVSNLNFMI